MTDYTKDIRSIRGIGEKRAQAFNRLGVFSLFDLISCFPRRYEDRSIVKAIADTAAGESVCISAVVSDEPRLHRIRRGMELVKFRAVDQSGVVDVTFFNQPYIRQQIHRGDELRFFGRIEMQGVRRSMTNPIFEPESGAPGAEAVTGRRGKFPSKMRIFRPAARSIPISTFVTPSWTRRSGSIRT